MVTFDTLDDLLAFLTDHPDWQNWRDESGYHVVEPLAIPEELQGVTKLPNSLDNVRCMIEMIRAIRPDLND